MPEAFSFSSAPEPDEHAGPQGAFCVSLVIVALSVWGDIAPEEGRLRIVAPLEGLVGFALLTATVSWILGIHPALNARPDHSQRRRPG
ncbi:hypothetical protein ACFVP3_01555 [Streptomyces sp. NPDC057806]|uniref:hypothetical protein n=1 Tax=Streptomyces sp. NPDC057806 TaxID=3346255 RepID=UPI00368F686E